MSDKQTQQATQPKHAVQVYVKCTDGDYFTGSVYLDPRQRLSDLMNDERSFVPVQQDNGRTIVLAKTSIRWIGDLLDDDI